MRNLTTNAIDYKNRAAQPDFKTGCEGIVVLTPSGEPARMHVANNGWLYVNGVPLGVGGMPPAPHSDTHFTGGEDAIAPEDIGAASSAELTDAVSGLDEAIGQLTGVINTLESDLLSATTQLADLKEAAVLSTSIRTLEGSILADGVGELQFTQKQGTTPDLGGGGGSPSFDGIIQGFTNTVVLADLQAELDKLNGKLIFGDVQINVLPGDISTTPLFLGSIFAAGSVSIIGSADKMTSTHLIKSLTVQNTVCNKIYIQGFTAQSTETSFLTDTTNGTVVFNKCVTSTGNRNIETNLGFVAKDGIMHIEDCFISNKFKAVYATKGGDIKIADANSNGSNNYYCFYADGAGELTTNTHAIKGSFNTTTVQGGAIDDAAIAGVTSPSPFAMVVIDINSTVLESYNLKQTRLSVGRFKYTFTDQPKRQTYGIQPTSPYNTFVPRADKLQSSFVIEYTDRTTGTLIDPQTATITVWHNA